jgi:tetratricopeptide (TPR) repeat protein
VDDLPPDLEPEQGFPGWCAPSSNGHTLITLRGTDYAGIGTTVPIDVLEPEPALELLTQVRKPQTGQERAEAQALTEDLGRHALALDVAGHFLLKTLGFAALRDELARAESDPLGEWAAGLKGQLPGGHEKSIVATLLQSVRWLGEEGLNLLRLAGELHGGTPVPFRLAQGAFARAFALDEETAVGYLARAVNQLETHSLATLALGGMEGDAFSVHALVRYSLLRGDPAGQEAPRRREVLGEATVAVLPALLSEVVDIRQHARLELVIAHAQHLAAQPRTVDEAEVATKLARFEGERGNYSEARASAEKALSVLEDTLGADHPETLTTRNNIAAWTGETGEAREALRLFRELLPDQTRVLGADHPGTANTRKWIEHLEARLAGGTGPR